MKNYLELFSPAYNRKRYIKNLKGFTDEFCHNLYRIIMRPNCSSTYHWINEMYTWLDTALGVNMELRKKPINWIFSFLFDNHDGKFEFGSNSDYLIRIISYEKDYGPVINFDKNYIKDKVYELYSSINPVITYSKRDSTKLFLNWYLSIDGSNIDIIPENTRKLLN